MTTANKYHNGKVYKLANNVDDEIYVGSTTQYLSQRKAGHRRDTISRANTRVYKHLNEIGWDNVDIILIENYSCNSKDELNARERYWIDELKPSLNKQLPLRTMKEYYEQHKDVIAQKNKKFRQQNKDKVLQKNKKYYEQNKDKVLQKNKEYYEQNKDQLTQKKKEYYEQNKDMITQKNNEKIKCDCGCEVIQSNLTRHKKTQKHQAMINNNLFFTSL